MALKFLITGGPTREFFDPIRFISNQSSGKMGVALVRAACARKHEVVFVHGPLGVGIPSGCRAIPVTSAHDMYRAVLRYEKGVDILIMAAAVADYTPVAFSKHKIKKKTAQITIVLKKTPDILKNAGNINKHLIKVGFAAETGKSLKNAYQKLKEKNCHLIVYNNISGTSWGMNADHNKVTVIDRRGYRETIGPGKKTIIARKIIKTIEQMLVSLRG